MISTRLRLVDYTHVPQINTLLESFLDNNRLISSCRIAIILKRIVFLILWT